MTAVNEPAMQRTPAAPLIVAAAAFSRAKRRLQRGERPQRQRRLRDAHN